MFELDSVNMKANENAFYLYNCVPYRFEGILGDY